jgi:Nif11 domain
MLSKSIQTFNDRVAADPALQTKLRAITSPLEFLALAKSEDDLQQAAVVAETIPGFSFEKLWFRGLGLIN